MYTTLCIIYIYLYTSFFFFFIGDRQHMGILTHADDANADAMTSIVCMSGEVEFVYVRTVGVTPGPGAFYMSYSI